MGELQVGEFCRRYRDLCGWSALEANPDRFMICTTASDPKQKVAY